MITYGKNLMGSHASQLTEERWKIVNHVLHLRNEISPDPNVKTEDMNQTEA